MRIVDPFKVTSLPFYATEAKEFASHVDISAKVQVFESGGGTPRESIFDYTKGKFTPLTIGVNWGTTDRIRIEVEIKYKLMHIPPYVRLGSDFMGSGSGTMLAFQEWVIQYPEEGLLIRTFAYPIRRVGKREYGDFVARCANNHSTSCA